MPGVLGVVLAGGRSTRFGSPKAFATLAGLTIIERILARLTEAAVDAVIVANDEASFRSFGRPVRPDRRPRHGALGGLDTALAWAGEVGADAALVVACDLPFVSAGLLGALASGATATDAHLPESPGPLGLEPLCGVYGVDLATAVAAALDSDDNSMESLIGTVPVRRLPLARVRSFGDPAIQFLNVNRPSDLERAGRILDARGILADPLAARIR